MDKFYQGLGKMLGGTLLVGFSFIFLRSIALFFLYLSALAVQWLFGSLIVEGVQAVAPQLHLVASEIAPVAVVIGAFASFFFPSSRTKEG